MTSHFLRNSAAMKKFLRLMALVIAISSVLSLGVLLSSGASFFFHSVGIGVLLSERCASCKSRLGG